jgi:formate--tetrahydrofolate ligase
LVGLFFFTSRLTMPIRPIRAVGADLGLLDQDLIPYGRAAAKIDLSVLDRLPSAPRAKYILVTAINPTPLGEGKTTTSIGLTMGLCRLGHQAVATLRQPSIGPVFGIKGGGTGGGKAQLYPMESINLHLTGDAHAVGASHNLLAAFVDNHLFHGNELRLDPARITWPRVMNVSDRALRHIQLEGADGRPGRQGQFIITEASEIMAILALATNREDLVRRLSRILVGFTTAGKPVLAEQLACSGSMAALLNEALAPNLVQTLEGNPVLVHTGPFGNIAHGNCSILADAIALRCADYVVTEAGFGSDLGAEKFCHIKCRTSGLKPDLSVVVATLRALKHHGGGGTVRAGFPLPVGLTGPNPEALSRGVANLVQHIANMKAFGIPVVVAINAFEHDPAEELDFIKRQAIEAGAVAAEVSTHFMEGGQGAEALAKTVVQACQQPSHFRFLYADKDSFRDKITTVATTIYGAAGVSFSEQAERQMEQATQLGYGHFPVCMAKTPLSLSHDATLLGRPTGFIVPINEVRILAGAGFVTAVCSGMQLMPGLPKRPAGERISLDTATGTIIGLT